MMLTANSYCGTGLYTGNLHHFLNPVYFKNTSIMKNLELKNSEKLAIVSDCDFGYLSRFEWSIDYKGYVIRTKDGVPLHKIIIGTSRGKKQIDHINRDKLDNRIENLRLATATQNSVNRAPKKEGQYKGVTYLSENRTRKRSNGEIYCYKRVKLFRAVLKHDGVNYSLGTFSTAEEAAHAYDKKSYELFGDFAYINLPHLLDKSKIENKAHLTVNLY